MKENFSKNLVYICLYTLFFYVLLINWIFFAVPYYIYDIHKFFLTNYSTNKFKVELLLTLQSTKFAWDQDNKKTT